MYLLTASFADLKDMGLQLDASNAALEVLLRESRDTLRNLQQRARSAKDNFSRLESDVTDFHDEIYSPLSKQGVTSSSTSTSTSTPGRSDGTLFETLQSMQARIQSLNQAKTLFEKLAKVEELALIAKEQVKLPTVEPCLETYRELVLKVQAIGGGSNDDEAHGGKAMASSIFVVELVRITQKDLTKALDA